MYSDHYSSKRELAKQLVFLNKDWKSQHQRVIGIIYQCQIIRWRGMHIHNVRGRPGQVQLHAQRPYRCLLPKPAHIVSGSRRLNSRAQAPGKVKVKAKALVTQSCLTLHDHMNCSLSGSSVHGILQARILEWVAMLSSRGSSWPRGRTRISYCSLPLVPPGKPPNYWTTREFPSPLVFFFFFFNIYLFVIYFWLCWVFIVALAFLWLWREGAAL